MSETDIGLVIAVTGLAGLFGVAYFLDRRRKRSGPIGPELSKAGPLATTLLWIVRLLVVMMVASVIAFFLLRSLTPIWITLALLLAYVIVGRLYQIARLGGK